MYRKGGMIKCPGLYIEKIPWALSFSCIQKYCKRIETMGLIYEDPEGRVLNSVLTLTDCAFCGWANDNRCMPGRGMVEVFKWELWCVWAVTSKHRMNFKTMELEVLVEELNTHSVKQKKSEEHWVKLKQNEKKMLQMEQVGCCWKMVCRQWWCLSDQEVPQLGQAEWGVHRRTCTTEKLC